MSGLKRRNRLLGLRLTQEEYERLKSACAIAGGHNLSEFTRSELLNLVQGSICRGVERRLCELENRVGDLQVAINNLSSLAIARAQRE